MSNKRNSKTDSSQSLIYQIRVEGHLGQQWMGWFDGLTITLDEDGDTLLTGLVVDQAALQGLLKKVRDLGMPLVSVIQIQFNRSDQGEKMNPSTTAKKIDTKVLFSTLWIFLAVNYIYRDILSNMEPGTLQGYLAGTVGEITITQ